MFTTRMKLRWQVYDGMQNTDILVDFLLQLVKSAGDEVCLLLGNLRMDDRIRRRPASLRGAASATSALRLGVRWPNRQERVESRRWPC